MAGHSHWHNIKYKKDKQDAKKAKNNQKYSREISVAAQKGESYLNAAVEAAKANGVSKEIIEKAIKKARDSKIINGEQVVYEIFGPNGAAIIAEGFSEQPQKSLPQIKEVVNRYGGALGQCLHLFIHEGIAEIKNAKFDDIFANFNEFLIDYEETEDCLMISFEPKYLQKIIMSTGSFEILRCEVIYRAMEYIKLDDENQKIIDNLIEKIENLEFVQDVYTNIEE